MYRMDGYLGCGVCVCLVKTGSHTLHTYIPYVGECFFPPNYFLADAGGQQLSKFNNKYALSPPLFPLVNYI